MYHIVFLLFAFKAGFTLVLILNGKQSQIGILFLMKRTIFLHACATCSDLPSNISTMGITETRPGSWGRKEVYAASYKHTGKYHFQRRSSSIILFLLHSLSPALVFTVLPLNLAILKKCVQFSNIIKSRPLFEWKLCFLYLCCIFFILTFFSSLNLFLTTSFTA